MSPIQLWMRAVIFFCVVFAVEAQQPVAPGQQPPGTAQDQPPAQNNPSSNPNQAEPGSPFGRDLPPDAIRPNYVLGPNDQVLIRTNADEINEKPFRIDAEGKINLPLLGRVTAGGLTVQELETDLVKRLREYIREPQVIINVTQFRSSPVFFIGAFRNPGIYPLQGTRTLVEMLTQIGGLSPNASRHIRVTRRAEYGPIPLPAAVDDQVKKVSTVEISIGSLRENINPAEDILLQPYDQITVDRAEQVYVTGEVGKTGGFELGDRESISMAQALTMAGGFTRDALKGKVRILRPITGTNRRAAIDVDVKRIFEGKDNDVPLLPNDILYVPRSYSPVFWRTLGTLSLSLAPYMIFLATQ